MISLQFSSNSRLVLGEVSAASTSSSALLDLIWKGFLALWKKYLNRENIMIIIGEGYTTEDIIVVTETGS